MSWFKRAVVGLFLVLTFQIAGARNALPDSVFGKPEVKADIGRIVIRKPLTLNNRSFFPVGVAGAPLDMCGQAEGKTDFDCLFGTLTDSGMNTFMPLFMDSEGQGTSTSDVLDFYPDTCNARRKNKKGGLAALKRSGLAAILPTFAVVEDAATLTTAPALDPDKARKGLGLLNECYRGIPTLSNYSYDDAVVLEGKGVPPKKLVQLKQFATEIWGPDTPMLLVHPDEESVSFIPDVGLRFYLEAMIRANTPKYSQPSLADIFGIYVYPVPFSKPSDVGRAVDRINGIQPSPVRPLVVLQGFSFNDADANVPGARRPTAKETRFMAYDAIVHGAGGVLWWGANLIPSNSKLWRAIQNTTQEIEAIEPWLTTSDARVKVTASQAGIGLLLKQPVRGGREYLLIAVNTKGTPRSTVISIDPALRVESVREIFEGRKTPVHGAHFISVFSGNGVHVYAVTPAPAIR